MAHQCARYLMVTVRAPVTQEQYNIGGARCCLTWLWWLWGGHGWITLVFLQCSVLVSLCFLWYTLKKQHPWITSVYCKTYYCFFEKITILQCTMTEKSIHIYSYLKVGIKSLRVKIKAKVAHQTWHHRVISSLRSLMKVTTCTQCRVNLPNNPFLYQLKDKGASNVGTLWTHRTESNIWYHSQKCRLGGWM